MGEEGWVDQTSEYLNTIPRGGVFQERGCGRLERALDQ